MPLIASAKPPASYAFEDIFIKYSNLELTRIEDRPVAISGLIKRLERFYNSKITHGIVHRYLHKSLLWQRSGKEGLDQLSRSEVATIPSWSWLAVKGKIRYNVSHLCGVRWNPDIEVVQYPCSACPGRYALQAPLCFLRDSCIKNVQETDVLLRDAKNNLVGWIRFDQDDKTYTARLGCIAVGEQKSADHDWALFGEDVNAWKQYAEAKWHLNLNRSSHHYVLLVERIRDESESSKDLYCRLGVGVVQDAWLSKSEQSVWII